jgi:fructose-1,6-bisphosphatase/sedoheptulose 1,7-bisphosphatase-like protein
MAFTLWLSAEEERILEKIMRVEGTRNKEQAVIKAIRDKGAQLASLPAIDVIDAVEAPVPALQPQDLAASTLVVAAPVFATLDAPLDTSLDTSFDTRVSTG